jgi:prepilin-type N-terminal cleavage/methylation domain-containing protein
MKGFTLVELILVIAIIAVLAAMAVPTIGTFANRTQTDSTTEEVVSALRYAQQKAMAGIQGSKFGVYFDDPNNKFYVFRGDSFGENPDEHIEFSYPDSVTVSQGFVGSEVNFERIQGMTADVGNITVTNNIGQTEQISVSAEGKIELE